MLLLAFGAGREATAPKPGAENALDHSQKLTSFDHLFHNWTDLFGDLSVDVTHKLVDWQMEQGSTVLFPFRESKFYIAEEPAQKL